MTSDVDTTQATAATPPGAAHAARPGTAALALGAMGIVFGDLGTSPLYALQDAFVGGYGIDASPDNVLGVVSLFIWSLLLVVCVKYLVIIMRADNDGEGGILALLALAATDNSGVVHPHRARKLFLLGVAGSALLYGDGAITPAISVLSAVEGLKMATAAFDPFVVPITVLILLALFAMQSRGTGRIGRVFGPVLLLWFAVIGALGIWGVAHRPESLQALDPRWGVRFFLAHGLHGIPVLGAVVLCLTGGEALYADMGHFGKRPIRIAWFSVALPALVLSYLGQCATLLQSPATASSPFYSSTPPWLLYPMVILATAATVIASQALISAVFSMTRQAMQLGLTPRLHVIHTSALEMGQVYLPSVNWALMLACIALVVSFGSSTRLAAAFGLAVSGTMFVTTILFGAVAHRRWGWSWTRTAFVTGGFLLLDIAFLGANLLKLLDGGWIPLLIGGMISVLLLTWQKGRIALAAAAGEKAWTPEAVAAIMDSLRNGSCSRVGGTAVFLGARSDGLPRALLHNVKHNRVLHANVILLTVETLFVPHVTEAHRVEVTPLADGVWRVVGRFGFMEEPDVPALMARSAQDGVPWNPADTTYFLGRETIVDGPNPALSSWRAKLFGVMVRNARSATSFFRLPPNRVVELGVQVEL
ncbi:MAG: potassium transporter Kup [Gemmatimonadaceae bacterium]|nr:potassium transporter Kup [Gemmatimonadaceae bacterium]